MNTLMFPLEEDLGAALGWMLLHSLWQAALIGLVTGIALILFRHKNAAFRYWVANAGLISVLLAAILTFCLHFVGQGSNTNREDTKPLVGELIDEKPPAAGHPSPTLSPKTIIESSRGPIFSYFERHLPLAVTLWMLGICFFFLRLLGNLAWIHTLKSRWNFPPDPYWVELFDDLLRRSGIRHACRLAESGLVRTPLTVGYWKPVILFPIGFINKLSPGEVEAILAHELAHIARNDYLFNLIQSLVETLFYYHPAVWWLSARIRHERELAADDRAVALTGDAFNYARALVRAQEWNIYGENALAPAFSGSKKSRFYYRIHHILNIHTTKNLAMEKLIGTGMILLVLFGIGFAQSSGSFENYAPFSGLASNGSHSGLWEGEIQGDKVCMTFTRRSPNNWWSSYNCFAKSEFSALPVQESEFTVTRPAGTMTFKGKFENNAGYGRFTFAGDENFKKQLRDNGVTGLKDDIMPYLFIGNCTLEFVQYLRQKGYDPISGEDLGNLAIHEVSKQNIEEYTALFGGKSNVSLEDIVNLKIHDVNAAYVADLKKAGFSEISAEEAMNAKIHDLSPEYVAEWKKAGNFNLNLENALNFKIHNIQPAFIQNLKNSGLADLSEEDILNMSIHEVSPETIANFKAMGFKEIGVEEALNLKIHGITPEFLEEMRKAGFKELSAEEAINLKIHDVNPAFIAEISKAGFGKLDVEEALNLKIHEVSPAFVAALKSAGFEKINAEEALNMKIHGVSPEYIKGLKDMGFEVLDIDAVLNAKIHDLSPAFVQGFRNIGFKSIGAEEAVNAKIHDLTPEFIQSMREKGFKDMSLEEYLELKIQYGHRLSH